jgi:hypothetical protein
VTGTLRLSSTYMELEVPTYVGRAADIFSLGCIFADLIVTMNANGNVLKFRSSRSSKPREQRWLDWGEGLQFPG